MAFSILSLGMFAARAFWITRRSVGLVSGLGPPAFTAMAMSFPIRVKAFAILSHRLNIVALRVSKMRPMANGLSHARGRRRMTRQPHRERRPAARLALDGDGAAHGIDHLPHDPQAQPEAAVVAPGDGPFEAAEDAPRSSPDMPMPSSLTTSQTSASSPGPLARTSTEIGRPAPYLTALDSRFVRICSRRRRSQTPSIAPCACTCIAPASAIGGCENRPITSRTSSARSIGSGASTILPAVIRETSSS